MEQNQTSKLEFWLHLGVGILTIMITLVLAGYIFMQVGQGMFPWWVYPAFVAYTIAILVMDDRRQNRQEANAEKSTDLNSALRKFSGNA